MSLTQSGPVCDVCGLHILPIGDEMVNTFDMSVFPGKTLIADNKCAAAVKHISETTGDWKELPEGPMRQAFKDWAQKNCALHEGMEKVYACAGCERSDIQ